MSSWRDLGIKPFSYALQSLMHPFPFIFGIMFQANKLNGDTGMALNIIRSKYCNIFAKVYLTLRSSFTTQKFFLSSFMDF
jgi:hypothetical protein